jgi:hypothetical protein
MRVSALVGVIGMLAAVGAGAQELYVPAAAHASGVAGTEWRSDLEVKAVGTEAAGFTLELLRERADNSAPDTASFTVEPGTTLRLVDVVDDTFGVSGSAALRLTPTHGTLLATSRTYNDAPGGTYGQYIPAMPAESAAEPARDHTLIQLSSTSSFRTNLGLVNATGHRTTVDVGLFDAAGTPLGSTAIVLRPYEMRQVGNVFSLVTTDEVPAGYATVRTETEGARFFAYASVVDNLSGDAIFIPAQLDEPTPVGPDPLPPRFVVFETFMRDG